VTWSHPHQVARRATVVRRVTWAVFGVLIFSFFRLQVLSGNRYALQSDQNRLRALPVPAPRGLILDRTGQVLAENVPGYSVALIAPSADSLRTELARLTPFLTLDSAAVDRIVRRYQRDPYNPVTVEHDVGFETLSAIEERRIMFPGLVVQAEPKRTYPFGAVAAHAVGYVSEINEEELASDTIPDARPGMLVGRAGLEREYDARLRGKDGERFVEVDALGRTVRDRGVVANLDPEPGENLKTSIDIQLQQYVANIFPHNARGAVVVLDPRTGEILALYSSPSYDPNLFIGGIDPQAWEELSQRPDHPLFDRAISAAYPPASPWKLLVAAIALRRGLVNLHSHMPSPCRGGLQYYNRYFRCWKVEGHGDLDLEQAIAQSCDVYFYQLGLKVGLDNLMHDATELGMNRPVGVDLPGERTSFFPASREYYNRRYGPRGWTSAVTLNLAIGQGEDEQTPINMVHFFAMLANPTGSAPAPHFVDTPDVPEQSLGLTPEQLAGLRKALVAVVEGGTAEDARIDNLHIAGKTGTAQNVHGPDHGWFVAFAPAEHPRVVVGAIQEFAEHGSAVAPMVTSIIARYLLGPEGVPDRSHKIRLLMPDDTAPKPVPIVSDTTVHPITPNPRGGTTRPR
jgi:penicillin-binding protein 2